MSRKPWRRSDHPPPRRNGILWLLAAVVVGMASLMMFFVGHVSVLTVRRVETGRVQGTLETSFLRIIPLSTTPLPGLREARLEMVPDKKNSTSPTFRVLFVTDGGTVPMTGFSSGGRERHQDLADRINALLRDEGRESFAVWHVGGGWFAVVPAVAVGTLLLALALGFILAGKRALAAAFPRGAGARG